MKMRRGSIALALVLAAAVTPALAQNVPEQPAAPAAPAAPQDAAHRFQAYIASQGYKGFVAELAAKGESISAPECKEHKPKAHSIVAIFAPPAFGEGVHPISGAWFDRVVMDRCGTEVFQNLLMRASPDNRPPAAALLLPGDTGTLPPMQGEVINDVLAALAKNKCTDATQIIPVNTKRGKETKPVKVDAHGKISEGAWKETWTLRACGKTVNATIDLSADGKGGINHKVKL